jgi:hypothetical protein
MSSKCSGRLEDNQDDQESTSRPGRRPNHD